MGSRLRTVSPISEQSQKETVLVWAEAAKFFGARIQDPTAECEPPHEARKADMSMAAAKALKAVLGQLEAAHMLMANREMVVQDITNSGKNGLKGGKLTQQDLKRVDSKHRASVDEMVNAVACRLLGHEASGPSTPEGALAWAQAAVLLSKRIQGSSSEMAGRAPDMSMRAATAMRAVLADIEASNLLMCNRETIVADITNPGPGAVKGGQLSQQGLKRVDRTQNASVDRMIREVSGRLLGKKMTEPSTSSEAKVWEEAASFFNARLQSSSHECRGRNPDMSQAAAKAMRSVLASIPCQAEKIDAYGLEAARLLMFDAERVVRDITNPGPKNIDGKTLTQQQLKRVDVQQRVAVDAMIGGVCCRLLGKTASPSTSTEGQVWAQAASYLSGRIQGSPDEMRGRNPDMSSGAAAALRTVLKQI